jgi:hypothetical protein
MFLVESGERPEGRRRLSDKKVSKFIFINLRRIPVVFLHPSAVYPLRRTACDPPSSALYP